jgi:hypothetical protein
MQRVWLIAKLRMWKAGKAGNPEGKELLDF